MPAQKWQYGRMVSLNGDIIFGSESFPEGVKLTWPQSGRGSQLRETKALNQLGENGWEVYSVSRPDNGTKAEVLRLRRPVDDNFAEAL